MESKEIKTWVHGNGVLHHWWIKSKLHIDEFVEKNKTELEAVIEDQCRG